MARWIYLAEGPYGVESDGGAEGIDQVRTHAPRFFDELGDPGPVRAGVPDNEIDGNARPEILHEPFLGLGDTAVQQHQNGTTVSRRKRGGRQSGEENNKEQNAAHRGS